MTRLLSRALRRRRRPRRPTVLPGLPDGLPADVLEHTLLREAGTSPTNVQHLHLSGWKRTGAYRLMVQTPAGSTSLIFKDAQYSADHVPALDGLPVRPGRPEFAVYAGDHPALKSWAPRAMWTREGVPDDRYLYLLEDLAPDFETPTGGDALVALCGQLPLLHRDLNVSFRRSNDLLRYDGNFGDRLLEYAAVALHRYAHEEGERQVVSLLDRWERVDEQLRRSLDDGYGRLDPQPLHGDLNLANVLTARDGSGELRLLDWEWAGYGLAHLDLAAALKAADPDLEHRALTAYHRALAPQPESFSQLWRTYQGSKLLRVLLDASFLARQYLGGAPSERVNLGRYVRSSVVRARHALDELERKEQHARG